MFLQKIEEDIFKQHQVELYLYRLDLLHPEIGGNKFFKLKYNLEEAGKQKKTTLLTFGGAYSNHIYATAAAGKIYGFHTIGIIRGEAHSLLNPVLQAAIKNGMHLAYLSREQYRIKESAEVIQSLKDQFGDVYILPEGSSNSLAVKGCREIMQNVSLPWEYVCTSVGTGGTLAGLTLSLQNEQNALGFSVLKNGEFLSQNIKELIKTYQTDTNQNQLMPNHFQLLSAYHFGGYAKKNKQLTEFIATFEKKHQVVLDWIYNGKMLVGIYDLVQKSFFPPGSRIIALHTGGINCWMR